MKVARPEGFEPPTTRFEAWYSIQLSYGRLIESLLCVLNSSNFSLTEILRQLQSKFTVHLYGRLIESLLCVLNSSNRMTLCTLQVLSSALG